MKKIVFPVVAFCAMQGWASAIVSDVTFSQAKNDRRVTVKYTIDEPAIVTVDVQTNRGDGVFVSIGDRNVRGFTGEVNKLVTTVGEPVTLTWRPDFTWDWGGRIEGENAKVVVTAWSTNAPPDYMAVSLLDPDVVRYYVSPEAFPQAITSSVYKTDWLVMRRIHAAGVPFRMGSTALENAVGRASGDGSYLNQGDDIRIVTLTSDYYMGIFEFTIGQWLRLCSATPGGGIWANAERAVPGVAYNVLRGAVSDGINWPDTGSSVKKGSAIDDIREALGLELDLPTEAQWEYACRAGTSSGVYGAEHTEDFIAECAWYRTRANYGCTWGETFVGAFKPNPWGLYDMYGGQWEYCLDKVSNGNRIYRGGGWNIWWTRLTSSVWAARADDTKDDTMGFRLVAPCIAPYKTK